MVSMVGRTIGHFRIVEHIGEGGMGVVYRARDEHLHRDVALKCLPPGSLSSEDSILRFRREALALSKLNHPGIAIIHDFLSEDGQDYLVMEYIAGESLDQRVLPGPLPESEAIALGIQLADALAVAHREGLIHRDLKPANLRVTPEGRLKILDFGVAKQLAAGPGATETMNLTAVDEMVGTGPYLAPELLRGAVASVRSDVYAAGAVLYELATGSRLFPGMGGQPLFAAILHQDPPTPRERNPLVSESFERIIQRCLEKDSALRPASAVDLADELRRLGSPRTPQPFASERRLAWGAAVATVLALLVFVAGPLIGRRREGGGAAASGIQSLAVLPLGNVTQDPEQEYFAAGMTEELTTQLAHIQALRVTSATSAMSFKNSRRSMKQIAGALHVDGVIEGSVLRSRDHVRITARLIHGDSDQQVWAGQYDGDTTDVLALQTKVASAIVSEIRVRLTQSEQARLARPRKTDPGTYDLYLRGRYQWGKRSNAGILRAIDYFEQATRRDSQYAVAYSGLADAWTTAGLYGLSAPREAHVRARRAAVRAIELDPELSEAHASLGMVLHNFEWDWAGSEQEYQRAIALNANNADAHHWYSMHLAQRGLLARAGAEQARAVELDPVSISIASSGGVLEYFARHYEVALENYRRAAEIDSSSAFIHRLQAGALDRLGREDEAVRELLRSLALQGQGEVAAGLAGIYRTRGLRPTLETLISMLVQQRALGGYQSAEHVAELYARLGQKNQGLEWLETAFREGDTELNRLKVDPIFDSLRSDPRFDELLRRVGLDRAGDEKGEAT